MHHQLMNAPLTGTVLPFNGRANFSLNVASQPLKMLDRKLTEGEIAAIRAAAAKRTVAKAADAAARAHPTITAHLAFHDFRGPLDPRRTVEPGCIDFVAGSFRRLTPACRGRWKIVEIPTGAHPSCMEDAYLDNSDGRTLTESETIEAIFQAYAGTAEADAIEPCAVAKNPSLHPWRLDDRLETRAAIATLAEIAKEPWPSLESWAIADEILETAVMRMDCRVFADLGKEDLIVALAESRHLLQLLLHASPSPIRSGLAACVGLKMS